MQKLLELAKKEYSAKKRFTALFFEAIFFLVILPFLLVWLGGIVDRWLHLPGLSAGVFNLLLGVPVIFVGWLFAIWSIYVQFTIGRGTPIPVMATQELIIQPPYSYTRNPMALGAILMYTGVCILVGSIGSFLLVVMGAAALLTYIHRFEEQEMVLRFGDAYLAYRRRTPFFIPRFRQ